VESRIPELKKRLEHQKGARANFGQMS
jgi:hypothetical protein